MIRHLNSDRPLVSAVVPAYNAGRYIGQTLRSLVTQTYPNMEIVVVDDGSHDATVPLIQEMARLHPQVRVIQQGNAGVAAARNRGVQESRGVFIALIDADDIWRPDAAERLVDCLLHSEPSVGVAYGWWVTIDEDGLLDGRFRCSLIEGDVFGTLLCHNFLGNASSTMIRRSYFERVGGYDCQFHAQGAQGCEDWDFYLRLAEHCRFRVVPEFIVGYRKSGGSMSSDATKMARSHQHLLRKVSQRHPAILSALYRMSTSSFYLYLAFECHRQRLPKESYRWLYRALKGGPLFTLVRPGFHALLVKNVAVTFGRCLQCSSLSSHVTVRRPMKKGRTHQLDAQLKEISEKRIRIWLRSMSQGILHRVVSRLPIS